MRRNLTSDSLNCVKLLTNTSASILASSKILHTFIYMFGSKVTKLRVTNQILFRKKLRPKILHEEEQFFSERLIVDGTDLKFGSMTQMFRRSGRRPADVRGIYSRVGDTAADELRPFADLISVRLLPCPCSTR